MKPLIIGIGHKKGRGKDTFARFLFDEFVSKERSVQIIGFADALKREVAVACRISVDELDANKSVFRPILQWWGTEFRRKYQNKDNYWIDQVDKLMKNATFIDVFIIPDVRFLNEAEFVRRAGGILLKINRPDVVTNDNHSSECELEDYSGWDYEIYNIGNLDYLKSKARYMVEDYLLALLKAPTQT
jgi:hypothetical protein